MATVTVNGKDVEIGDQERLNVIQAAQRAGVEIPHYCWHPALSVVASCRMCLVEVGDKKPDGTLAMQPKVVPGCQTPVKAGTVVVTNSQKVKDAQASTLEYLLLNHPLDCPVCDQAGECFLQDYSYRYGRSESRMQDEKLIKPDKEHIGDQIAMFTERCVMCSRCVRFTREVSGTGELQILHRGAHAEIDVFPGNPCDNKLAGNVVDICPVGALCSKDFLYKQRVWFLKSEKSVCPGCSTGCSVNVDQNKNIVYRLKPRFNPQAQGHFMCDEGRFGFKYINSKERLLTPQHRVGEKYEHATWEKVLPEIRGKLKDAARNYPETVGAMLSPWLTCEEAYLLCRWLRELSSKIRLAMGPIRLVGEDDRYPKDSHGNSPPVDQAKFTIRAEKCPNRRGVEAILRHYQGEVCSPDSLYHAAVAGELKTLYLVGGDPLGWITPEQATWLKNVHLLIVQDMLESPASSRAQYVLPSGSFAEKDGTFVNHARLAQAVHRAIVPPGEARADGRIFMELAELRGLYHAPTIRQQLAKEIPWFAPLASGDLGDFGVFLGEQ